MDNDINKGVWIQHYLITLVHLFRETCLGPYTLQGVYGRYYNHYIHNDQYNDSQQTSTLSRRILPPIILKIFDPYTFVQYINDHVFFFLFSLLIKSPSSRPA